MTGPIEQRIAAVTTRQRNRITREQLHAAGLTDAQIRHRAHSGSLSREHPGVYVTAPAAEVRLGRETGVLLSLRPGAVISHHSAAALWRIGPGDREVHVLVEGGGVRPRRGARIDRTRALPSRDIRMHEKLPVTSPARTLRDCTTTCSPRELERMFTEALTLRLVTLTEIHDTLAQTGRRELRHLLDAEFTAGQAQSDTERRLLALIRRAGLPTPRDHVRLHGFEADVYWPEHRLVVEVDSYGFHTSRWAYERDRRKDATFRAHDLTTMRFSRPQVLDEPLLVIAQIARELGAR